MIVVAARCYNGMKDIDRFLKGYSWADKIVISDGGSTDGSREYLERASADVVLLKFDVGEVRNGYFFNHDAPHMNYVLDYAKSLNPDWIVFDDLDCNPNITLRESARSVLESCNKPQVNAFRLYMWGDNHFFPKMSGYFDLAYTSIWAYNPRMIEVRADENIRHGTLVGLSDSPLVLQPPLCLMHHSWYPDTVQEKVNRYNAIGLPMSHPRDFAGYLEMLPEWATE